eukprot:9474715-Pyramimonas_sp.AAC.1
MTEPSSQMVTNLISSVPPHVMQAASEAMARHGLEQPLSTMSLLTLTREYWESIAPDRTLHLVMLFAGQGGGARATVKQGMRAAMIDYANEAHQDISCIQGCFYTAWCIKSVTEKG